MGIFNDWAQFSAYLVEAESNFNKALVDHPVLLGDARETIIRNVLMRILPSAFEIGRGKVVDSDGNESNQIDIVIARRDSLAFALSSGDKLYPVEAVLATIEVKSTVTKRALRQALNNCASIADLNPYVHGPSRWALDKKLGINKTTKGTWYHEDYLELQRYWLKAYPATYVYGFKGYKKVHDLAIAVEQWMGEREKWMMKQGRVKKVKNMNRELRLVHLPSVIVTQRCFGCRNAPPFKVTPDKEHEQPCHFSFGKLEEKEPPLRILVQHLLATLFAKMPWLPDIEGLRMEPRRYIEEIALTQDEGIFFVPPEDYSQRGLDLYWEGFP
ncbi:MAG: DUF6602 domain-containing protein [Acidobacteriota bacterium]